MRTSTTLPRKPIPRKPSRDQQRSMVRKLLADRFGLKVQVVQKDFPVYALTVVESPPKLTADESSGYDHGYVNVTDRNDGQTAVQFTHYTVPAIAEMMNSSRIARLWTRRD